MKIALTTSIDVESLKQELQTAFPHYKIKNAFLNKKTLRITNEMDQVVVGQHKDDMICVGNLNMLDLRIFIPFVLGISLFFITGLVFLIVMMQVRKKSFKAMEAEIGVYLKEKYNF
ncbi:hypothetical protein [uncultured Dokdonia sp.]|uniref:hypothetical protein n=1 Tax=uncultured Dokdonia sp. TaxID=575653 RepID=UPI0026272D85|nr:hypothetical protein [uncultured Dokdonia sp.]